MKSLRRPKRGAARGRHFGLGIARRALGVGLAEQVAVRLYETPKFR